MGLTAEQYDLMQRMMKCENLNLVIDEMNRRQVDPFEEEIMNDDCDPSIVRYPEICALTELMNGEHQWELKEIDFSQDRAGFAKLSAGIRHACLRIFQFFAKSDPEVLENLAKDFAKIQCHEIAEALASQAKAEWVHVRTYIRIIEELVPDPVLREKLLMGGEDDPVVGRKIKWAHKWIGSQATLGKKLIAWAIVEGIFFAGSFAFIMYLRKTGLVPGLAQANKYIFRDEWDHVKLSTLIYKLCIKFKVPTETVRAMFKEALEIEFEFIDDILPKKLEGMNSDLMKKYIEYVADVVLHLLGHERMHNGENPFEFMDLAGAVGRSSFFEVRGVSDYVAVTHSNVARDVESDFEDDDDF